MKKPKVVSTTKTVSPTKEDDIYGPDDPAEEAFTKSDVHALNDLELQPYTPDRAWAAQAMGLRYGFVDDAGVNSLGSTGFIPARCATWRWCCGFVHWRMR